jgi:hypothetical protein
MLASVFAKGFAGTTDADADGLSAGKLVPDSVLELAMPSAPAMS